MQRTPCPGEVVTICLWFSMEVVFPSLSWGFRASAGLKKIRALSRKIIIYFQNQLDVWWPNTSDFKQCLFFLMSRRLGFICTLDAEFLIAVWGEGLRFLWWSVAWLLSFASMIGLPWLYTTIPRADSNVFPYGRRSNLGSFSKISFLEWNPILFFWPKHILPHTLLASSTVVTVLILERVSFQCDKTVRGIKKKNTRYKGWLTTT